MRTGESDENMKEKEEKLGERDEMEVRLQSSGHRGGGCVHISLEEVKSFYRFSQSCQRLHNDIMQQESDRLFAADIDPDLRKRFAFLSGGRAENGSPIIVFPEFPAFGELQEEEFHNVLTYLTSVPSVTASGVGFILVIDRRQDRWTAVKGTLLRIAGSFPVNLQLVLVLRPSTLFQRTLSDIFYKFNRDEFKMKVPVVMLSSVTELHAYIDRTQLPQELGGTQDYCHDTWISHRTAIEAFALMEQVEKVFQKQVSMQEMFEKRRISLKKLAAKQTRPVQPVAPRPEAIIKFPMSLLVTHRSQETRNAEDNILNVENCRIVEVQVQNGGSRHSSLSEEEENLAVLRRHVMNELLETERAYVEELLCVLQGYAAEMDNPAMAQLLPSALLNRKDVLFGNMPEIYQFHKRTFLRELETYTDVPELVGRCFLERMGDLQIYEKYCQNKPRSESLWRQCSDCAFFQECQRKLEHKLGLDSYLLKPVQRITKYQLILKELLKYSKGCEGSEDLQEALSSILGILKAVNDSMHLIAITGYEGSLTELGRLLMQGSFSVWTEHKKGHAKVKDLARFKPMQRHLFLHEKALLFCKRREENGEGYEKAPSYSFKHSLNMSAVGITESAKGDNKKFEIWCNSREEVFIVQAATPEIKTSWLNEIRKVLTGQLKACRESSQKKASDTMSPSPTSNSPPICLSPFRNCQKSVKKGEEKKTDAVNSDPNSPSSHKEETVTSPTTDRASVAKKRFTLQGFSNLKSQKEFLHPAGKSLTLPMVFSQPGSPLSPDHKAKRHEIKSDPTPFGCKEPGQTPHITLSRAKWLSTSSLLQAKRRGWNKASFSMDVPEVHDGYSSTEDPMNSDPEDEGGRKLAVGDRFTVVADYEKEKGGPQDLSVKSGDMVQLIKEGDDGQWFVRNLGSNQDGWVAAANLLTLITESKSSQSLCSSEGSVTGNLSTSSSCSETYTSFSDIKP
ncbi:guanine nucleotide exchange factor DBS-like [Salmo trutta]|uniref:guanine nucleotide exchange factor DBS-like n=1 Tax=Salmo trutta TaxID=8032 RepID=UPI001130B4E8|nr:guanine nucleotide exchange factor DBS-like [Salmo trutta]